MSQLDIIIKALKTLGDEGEKLLELGQKPDTKVGELGPRYERWYTKALAVVMQIAPERLSEFKDAYRPERRKDITYENYSISDYLLSLQVTRGGSAAFNTTQAFAHKLLRQAGIIYACADAAPSVLRDIRSTLRAELLDADVDAARELRKAGHLRSAGVVCGVVLETHLRGACDRRGVKVPKKDPGISDLNDLLKGANAYDVPTWRLVQRLADIRNICGHRKDRDPKSDEVDDLISGTEKIAKEVF